MTMTAISLRTPSKKNAESAQFGALYQQDAPAHPAVPVIHRHTTPPVQVGNSPEPLVGQRLPEGTDRGAAQAAAGVVTVTLPHERREISVSRSLLRNRPEDPGKYTYQKVIWNNQTRYLITGKKGAPSRGDTGPGAGNDVEVARVRPDGTQHTERVDRSLLRRAAAHPEKHRYEAVLWNGEVRFLIVSDKDVTTMQAQSARNLSLSDINPESEEFKTLAREIKGLRPLMSWDQIKHALRYEPDSIRSTLREIALKDTERRFSGSEDKSLLEADSAFIRQMNGKQIVLSILSTRTGGDFSQKKDAIVADNRKMGNYVSEFKTSNGTEIEVYYRNHTPREVRIAGVNSVKQHDERWALMRYLSNTFAASACGPAALLNGLGAFAPVLKALGTAFPSLVKLADWAVNKGLRIAGRGTDQAFFDKAARLYGLTAPAITKSEIAESIHAGKPVVILSKGVFDMERGRRVYRGGHYMLACGYDEKTGSIRVADSASNDTKWIRLDRSTIGGAWAISS